MNPDAFNEWAAQMRWELPSAHAEILIGFAAVATGYVLRPVGETLEQVAR